MPYCIKCVHRLGSGVQFCTRCGAPVEVKAQAGAPQVLIEKAATDLPQSGAASPLQSTPVVPSQQQTSITKSGCMPAVLIVLGALDDQHVTQTPEGCASQKGAG